MERFDYDKDFDGKKNGTKCAEDIVEDIRYAIEAPVEQGADMFFKKWEATNERAELVRRIRGDTRSRSRKFCGHKVAPVEPLLETTGVVA